VFSSVKSERGHIINFNPTTYFSFYKRRPSSDTKNRDINYIEVKKAVVSDKHQTFVSVYLFLPLFYKERRANSLPFPCDDHPFNFSIYQGTSLKFCTHGLLLEATSLFFVQSVLYEVVR